MLRATTSACLLLVTSFSLLSCANHNPQSTPTGDPAPSQPVASQAFQTNGPSTDRSPTSSVTASLRTDRLDVPPGGEFNAIIDLRIAPGWYIYAADRPAAEAVPTSIRLELPPGIESAGEGSSPEPATTGSATGDLRFIYNSNSIATFQRPLRTVTGAPTGPKTIRCTIEYQACNRFMCDPPARVTLETTVNVSR